MIKPQPYTQKDFERNPGKYILFRTARIAKVIPSSPELVVGQIVSIRYFATQLNKARGHVEMPVYEVWPDDNKDLNGYPVMLYASALEGFAL